MNETLNPSNYKEFAKDVQLKYGIGYFNVSLMDRFALISLLGHLAYNVRKKNPDINTYRVLLKAINRNPKSWEIPFFMKVAAISDDFCLNNTEFETFGLKSNSEIVTEINRVVDSLIPF